MARACALSLAFSLWQAPSVCEATPSPRTQQQEDEARRAFREGTQAAETERWADSERAFRRAFELSHTASALFNQAVALRALGRHVEAHQAFLQLFAEFPDLSPALRAAAEGLARESRARIATVELHGLALTPHVVTVDGRPVQDSLARPLRLALDEGSHEVSVELPQHTPFVWRGQLEGGDAADVQVALVAEAPASEPEPERRRSALWWTLGITGVVAAGVGAAFLLRRASEDGTQVSTRTTNVYEVP